MSQFFAFPTINSWDEDVFQLTTAGIVTVIVLIALLIAAALLLAPKEKKSRAFATRQLVFSAMAMALATVTSMIKLFELPMGGSVTLLSMFFIVLIGYMYGPKAGLMTGFAYGLLQFVLDPVFYTIPQMIVDYPLAFGALGLSGLFCNKKYGLQLGYIVGVLGRFVFAWLSGVLFFAAYAEGTGMGPALYSLAYNGSYLLAEGIVTLIIISLPPVISGLAQIRKICIG
jgi:thiamine transporter